MKNKNRRILFLATIIVIAGAIYYLESMKIDTVVATDGDENLSFVRPDKPPLKEGKYLLAPELTGIAGYINTEDKEIKLSDYEGKVVLVDFWTYSCVNCLRTLPYLNSWDEKYRNDGLVIVGVHSPEFAFEEKKENVEKAVKRYNIRYPVVQDNTHQTWAAYQNRFWPRKYLIDSEGYIRYDHIGEGGYEETEMKIQELLREAGFNVSAVLTEENSSQLRQTTPELYASTLFAFPRGQFVGNKKIPEKTEEYILPNSLSDENRIYLNGTWTDEIDRLKLISDNGIIAMRFTATEVNIVAQKESEGISRMRIFIDGKPLKESEAGDDVFFEEGKSFIEIEEARLYNLYRGAYGNYRLDLNVENNFSFSSFTFG